MVLPSCWKCTPVTCSSSSSPPHCVLCQNVSLGDGVAVASHGYYYSYLNVVPKEAERNFICLMASLLKEERRNKRASPRDKIS